MDSDLPSWIQQASVVAVGCVSVFIAVWRYVKTEAAKAPRAAEVSSSHVVAASFVDSKLLKELIDGLREHQEENARVALRVTRSQTELREAVLENTEANRMTADAMLNIVRFMNRKGDL